MGLSVYKESSQLKHQPQILLIKRKENTIYCGKFDSIQFLDTTYI